MSRWRYGGWAANFDTHAVSRIGRGAAAVDEVPARASHVRVPSQSTGLRPKRLGFLIDLVDVESSPVVQPSLDDGTGLRRVLVR